LIAAGWASIAAIAILVGCFILMLIVPDRIQWGMDEPNDDELDG